MRFETDSAWKRNGSGIDQLAKELRLALQYPEGASFQEDSARAAPRRA